VKPTSSPPDLVGQGRHLEPVMVVLPLDPIRASLKGLRVLASQPWPGVGRPVRQRAAGDLSLQRISGPRRASGR
jgi:hypothetical protein